MLNVFRCKNCNRRLFDEDVHTGEFEIKCPKCKSKYYIKKLNGKIVQMSENITV